MVTTVNMVTTVTMVTKQLLGINNEEDWYENTSYWSSKGEEVCTVYI